MLKFKVLTSKRDTVHTTIQINGQKLVQCLENIRGNFQCRTVKFTQKSHLTLH